LVQARVFSRAAANADVFRAHDDFARRHLGPSSEAEVSKMLKKIGYKSLDALIDATVPAVIRQGPLQLGPGTGESETLARFKTIMDKNKVFRSFIGNGYYGNIIPTVILRNILENPAWYTPYTPYQAEVSQGRLEMLLNYQTMVTDLTGLPIANASLLDEPTAAGEALAMSANVVGKGRKTFVVDSKCNPQTIEVLKTRAYGFGFNIVVTDVRSAECTKLLQDGDVFGVMAQYPDTTGGVQSYADLTQAAHTAGAMMVVATDLLALTVLQPPGEWGADIVLGSAQRFGVPFGFGGPHAAFFATGEEHKRKMPGRLIGVSKDSRGKTALRMALQTREQHIRRDKATSNICTAQALLSNMAAAYTIYHGPEGLKRIARKVHAYAVAFTSAVQQLQAAGAPVSVANPTNFFDTVFVKCNGATSASIVAAAEAKGINVRNRGAEGVSVSFDESHTPDNVTELVQIFGAALGKAAAVAAFNCAAFAGDVSVPKEFARSSAFLSHPVFNMYHSETEMLRYLFSLQSKDISLAVSMISLGSCTMKLNATSEMIPVTWPTVSNIHPFAPSSQVQGYAEMLKTLHDVLADVTGFPAVSFNPNSGAQGEYAGLLCIRAYHESRGDAHRNVCLIPVSAHGTNPASAAMMGMTIVVVKCDEQGNVDEADLIAKAEQHKDKLAALMITYPSTHGVFETAVKRIIEAVHSRGGQVYMDGANMNAQVGLCAPGRIGADVCHLNLHKTFCIPHGGGGPGMGPIGVAAHLAPFLPSHPLSQIDVGQGNKGVGTVSGAPFSSAGILPISWMYCFMMGGPGLTLATKTAILNANYMRSRLAEHYSILFLGEAGTCAHEFIIDLRPIKEKTGISEEDVAKRLMDFNFHAPTMSFPVPGTLMVEPTESESLYELDRFCDAMTVIRAEIEEVATGKADPKINVLKGAPHTHDMLISDNWTKPYSREKAAYPLAYLRASKFWPTVGRLDNVFGDRNLVCTCPAIESYQQ